MSHRQGVLKQEGKDELGAKKGFDLVSSNLGEVRETEIAFPGFEKDLDAPAQTVELGRLSGRQEFLIGVGEE